MARSTFTATILSTWIIGVLLFVGMGLASGTSLPPAAVAALAASAILPPLLLRHSRWKRHTARAEAVRTDARRLTVAARLREIETRRPILTVAPTPVHSGRAAQE